MPTHTVVNITYNPLNTRVYTHQISPTEVRIQIVGEDTQVAGIRLRPLAPNGLEVPDTVEVSATL